MNYFIKLTKYILPLGMYNLWLNHKNKKLLLSRAERLKNYSRLRSKESNLYRLYDYEEAIRVLVSKALNENEIRAGSIPEKDLLFISSELKKCLNNNQKLTLLHIGNFVGISLCYIANFVKHLNEEGLVIAIDPNIEHRGIIHPQEYVKNLISYFRLDKNILLIDGFSLENNPKNDGGSLYTNEIDIQIETGCSHVLKNIAKITFNKFDVCIIDGNHEADYLFEEIKSLLILMKSGGYIILDDIVYWEDVKMVFNRLLKSENFRIIASNERIGIVKVVK